MRDYSQVDVVFFDMDHTLIDNDCDVSWKEFLVEKGLAPANEREEAQRHWEDYVAGKLEEEPFLAFQLRQFAGKSWEEMRELAQAHFEERVKPNVYPQALEAVEQAKAAKKPVAILSATNAMVVEPVARYFGMDGAICTGLEEDDNGLFTGAIVHPYCHGEGKIYWASQFADEYAVSLDQAMYFGDSIADIPMLRRVSFPRAVNPGEELRRECEAQGWPIENWTL